MYMYFVDMLSWFCGHDLMTHIFLEFTLLGCNSSFRLLCCRLSLTYVWGVLPKQKKKRKRKNKPKRKPKENMAIDKPAIWLMSFCLTVYACVCGTEWMAVWITQRVELHFCSGILETTLLLVFVICQKIFILEKIF